MKKTTLFLILAFALYHLLSGQNRPSTVLITIEESRIEVGDLLQEITRQSGSGFIYNSKVLDPEKAISFSVKNASLEQTLNELAKKIGVKYTIIDGEVVLNFADRPPPKKEPLYTLTGFLADQSSEKILSVLPSLPEGLPLVLLQTNLAIIPSLSKAGKYTLVYSHVSYEKRKWRLNWVNLFEKHIAPSQILRST